MEYSKEYLQTVTRVGFLTKPGKSVLLRICGKSAVQISALLVKIQVIGYCKL